MVNNRKKAIIVSWAVAILWMMMIFNLSAQPAGESDILSRKTVEIIIQTVNRVISIEGDDIQFIENVDGFHHLVRKYAHFLVYLVLSILLMNALERSRVFGRRIILFSLGICVLYAVTDELHQFFVPGRSGQLTDILIDISGAVLGVVLYQISIGIRIPDRSLKGK